MAFDITEAANLASKGLAINPQLVLEIDGVDTIFGTNTIEKFIRIGDPDLFIDGSWLIGGLSAVDDQKDYIQLKNTAAEISQQLDISKGIGTSVSSLPVSLLDKNQEITNIITPGNVVPDILGRRAKFYIGFKGTAWPEDYLRIFKGIIDDISANPGNITFQLASADQNKRQTIFLKSSAQTTGSISPSSASVTVDSVANFLVPILGPDGSFDPAGKTYLRIENEIIRYTGITGTTFTGLVRGQLGTTAASHASGSSADSIYKITDNAMKLALKFMLSGWNGPYVSDLAVKNFNQVDPLTNVPNAVFFENIDLVDLHNVTVGDYLTSTGASAGANNVTSKQIIDVQVTDFGTYLVVDSVSFVTELDSAALVSIRSQYDTLPDGLQMRPEDVDIAEHLRLFRLFLSSFDYDFNLTDDVDAKSFLDNQIYNPCAAFSIPRKTQASVGFHSGPLPTENLVSISKDNLVKPGQISLKRGLSKNFFNTIIYQIDKDVLSGDFKKGVVSVSGTSITRIGSDVGVRAFTIPAEGVRSALGGISAASRAGQRRLKRYQFGAEYFMGVQVSLRDSVTMEIGDIVLYKSDGLQVSDTKTGTRLPFTKLYEIVNKKLNYQTGAVTLDLTDTNFSNETRYCVISPASYLKSVVSASQFVIRSSFASIYGANEYLKWRKYTSPVIKVRSVDSTVTGNGVIKSIQGNLITLESPLGFTPAAGYIMEMADYSFQTDEVKTRHGFMRDTTFPDGKIQYQMI